MTTVTTFATAVDVTVNEVKLEAFLPVDEPTAQALRRFADDRHDLTSHSPGDMESWALRPS